MTQEHINMGTAGHIDTNQCLDPADGFETPVEATAPSEEEESLYSIMVQYSSNT